MPLHFIGQCCKCKSSISQDLWSIARNHKYSEKRYVCAHFDVEIDHESTIGFFGIGWSNTIKITAYYKDYNQSKTVINRTFKKNDTEYENYVKFNKIVFHARISDYSGNYPTCGNTIQDDIDYNENKIQEERKKMEQKRREEKQREEKIDEILEKNKIKNEETINRF